MSLDSSSFYRSAFSWQGMISPAMSLGLPTIFVTFIEIGQSGLRLCHGRQCYLRYSMLSLLKAISSVVFSHITASRLAYRIPSMACLEGERVERVLRVEYNKYNIGHINTTSYN